MNTFPRGRWTLPVLDHADQTAVLAVKPLAGLEAFHEAGGRYVLVTPSAAAPNQYELVAENLSQTHAQAICDAVNGDVK